MSHRNYTLFILSTLAVAALYLYVVEVLSLLA